MNQDSPSRRFFQLIWPGALVGQAVYVAAKLGVADLVGDEPKQIEEIAREAGAHPESLQRVLRVLTSIEVFSEDADGLVSHTPLSRTLRKDHPESTREWSIFLGSEWIWRPWGELHQTVRTGESPFERIFGKTFYDYMADHPEEAAVYDGAMSAGSAMIVESIVSAFDFSSFEKIVDVGGGQGQLLRGILEANPKARGVLLDRPRVVEGAVEFETGNLAGRCEIIGGDFFESVPEDGDIYLLKGIVHGFADDDAVKLLQTIRRAIKPDGCLMIIETVPKRSHEPNPQKAFMDLMMLALVPGKERSEEELRPLVEKAGFTITEVLPTPGPNSLVVCRVSSDRE